MIDSFSYCVKQNMLCTQKNISMKSLSCVSKLMIYWRTLGNTDGNVSNFFENICLYHQFTAATQGMITELIFGVYQCYLHQFHVIIILILSIRWRARQFKNVNDVQKTFMNQYSCKTILFSAFQIISLQAARRPIRHLKPVHNNSMDLQNFQSTILLIIF